MEGLGYECFFYIKQDKSPLQANYTRLLTYTKTKKKQKQRPKATSQPQNTKHKTQTQHPRPRPKTKHPENQPTKPRHGNDRPSARDKQQTDHTHTKTKHNKTNKDSERALEWLALEFNRLKTAELLGKPLRSPLVVCRLPQHLHQLRDILADDASINH